MIRKTSIAATVVLALTALVTAQVTEKQQAGKPIKFTALLAQRDASLLVDGKLVNSLGEKRVVTATLPAGKDEVNALAIWEPNNYTRIARPRKVKWKEGEIVVDFREPSNTEKDDIVVIFVPTPEEFVTAMCKLAKVGKDDVVFDLGCGDGRMVILAVKHFGAKRGVGIDLDPELIKQCKQNAKEHGVADKVDFRVGDVLKVDDLSEANVVLLYMGDDINLRLKPILQKTLKSGSRVVSHRFLMGDDWSPDRSEHVKATMGEYPGYEHDIHLWTIKGTKKK
jgi:SAM-dependent methyltransferase